MTDESIMEQVAGGNVQMMAILFERYHVKLFNYFLRLRGDRGASEDLTQEVFVRILKYRQTFRGDSKFSTWMYKIARNTFIDQVRKKKDDVSLEDQYQEEVAPEAMPDEQLAATQESEMIHKALAQLPPGKKEVLVLSRFQGMKYEEISNLLGCSIASVKVQVHRAIKDLRKVYLKLQVNGGAV